MAQREWKPQWRERHTEHSGSIYRVSDYIIVNPIVRISYGPGTYVIDKAKQLKHCQRLY